MNLIVLLVICAYYVKLSTSQDYGKSYGGYEKSYYKPAYFKQAYYKPEYYKPG